MGLGAFQFMERQRIGPGAASYTAMYEQREVEVRLLHEEQDPTRLVAQQRRITLASLLSHPGHQKILSFFFEEGSRVLALEKVTLTSLANYRDRLPMPWLQAANLSLVLLGVLHDAHRFGLYCGDLCLEDLYYQNPALKVDLSGVQLSTSQSAWTKAPEAEATRAADVYSAGAIFYWLLTGKEPSAPRAYPEELPAALRELAHDMLSQNPEKRPSTQRAQQILQQSISEAELANTLATKNPNAAETIVTPPSKPTRSHEITAGVSLGRFQIIQKIGEGALGVVFLAQDKATQEEVAVKILKPAYAEDIESIKRFHKEAKLQAELATPYIANLLEINEDAGCCFLAMEYVPGRSLKRYMNEHKSLPEPFALRILFDVARALAASHSRGIIHRDIKPDNIMFVSEDANAPSVKVTDFGIAGLVTQSESLSLTSANALLGTPLYMAPEQFSNREVRPAADIYAAGATLFHLLTGRPPFMADNIAAIVGMHCFEPAPLAKDVLPTLSERTSQLIARCLAKKPEERFASGSELADELSVLLFGKKSRPQFQVAPTITHPEKVIRVGDRFILRSPPLKLWEFLTNTHRLNRVLGFPPAVYKFQAEESGEVRRVATGRAFGIPMTWEERSYEWVKGRRLSLLKYFPSGPIEWMASDSLFYPTMQGGTEFHLRAESMPRGLAGSPVTLLGLKRAVRLMGQYAKRIDEHLQETKPRPIWSDAFEDPFPLDKAKRRLLLACAEHLISRGISYSVAHGLIDFLSFAPSPLLARIRPISLAAKLGVDVVELLAACLYAAKEGTLLLLWDVLCPACQSPASFQETLQQIQRHEDCEACNLRFDVDLSSSVELVFRPAPSVREVEANFYCISGPNHSPHVVAQMVVAPRERASFDLALEDGSYRLRVLAEEPFVHPFRVARQGASRIEFAMRSSRPLPDVFSRESQQITVTNPYPRSVRIRIESALERSEAITAAKAASLSLFRELFPGEVLSGGQGLEASSLVFLQVEALSGQGSGFHSKVQKVCERFSGGVFGAQSEMNAAFIRPEQATRAAFEIKKLTQEHFRGAIYQGAVQMRSGGQQFELSGDVMQRLRSLVQLANQDELIVHHSLAAQASVQAILQGQQLMPEKSPSGLVYRVSTQELIAAPLM